jgi:hypothetical protein
MRPAGQNEPIPDEFKDEPVTPATAPAPDRVASETRYVEHKSTKTVKSAPLTTQNVLKLAKTRLKRVKAELRDYRRQTKALEQEEMELERLVAAASEQPRVAPVRAIKTAG